MSRILTLLLVLTCLSSVSQNVGTWADHLPYSKAFMLAESPEEIFVSTEQGVYAFNKTYEDLRRISKTNVLNDVGVSAIYYDNASSTLIVGYINGNIDLVRDGEAENLPFIKLSQSINGDKQINKIIKDGSNVYLATSFGIVVLDLSKDEIKENYFLGPGNTNLQINDLCFTTDSIYAATEAGLFSADKNSSFLADLNQWTKMSYEDGNNITNCSTLNDSVYMVSVVGGNPLLHKYNGIWDTVNIGVHTEINALNTKNSKLYINHEDSLIIYDGNGIQEDVFMLYQGEFNANLPTGNKVYIASERYGLVSYETTTAIWKRYQPSGPVSNRSYKINIVDNAVWIAGGRAANGFYANVYDQPEVSSFIEGDWQKYSLIETSFFRDSSVFDIVDVAVDPEDPTHCFAATMSNSGLLELKNGVVINNFGPHNSSLEPNLLINDPNKGDVTALKYDEEGVLWVANKFSDKHLHAYYEGQWYAYDLGNFGNDLRCFEIDIDSYGNKYLMSPLHGVIIFNHNETLDDPSDDDVTILKTGVGQGDLPTLDVRSIAVDLEDRVWIGTEQGPAVFYNAADPYTSSDNDVQQILVDGGENIEVLLKNNEITAIAIDGANRKWIGTATGGLFLLSADGQEEVLHFTETNSPLFSNAIVCLEINHETGEVWIGSSGGVQTYYSDATQGLVDFSDDIGIYPNPVRPEYSGPIVIQGLMRDSDVKITDITGNLVYSTVSVGGQATWDGISIEGNRVSTGIYLVFVTNEDGSRDEVGKIAFVR